MGLISPRRRRPRFPSGLTITQAKGHWQAPGEPPQREASRVLEIVFDEPPYHDRRIDEIAATYKAIFQQESVMVVRMPANVCFLPHSIDELASP